MISKCAELDEAHLLSLVSNVGRRDVDGFYIPDEQCVETLQDVQKFLRQDNSTKQQVARQLLAWNFISKDLLPILRSHYANDKLVIHVVKLIVFLTMPTEASSHVTNVQQTQQYLAIDAILDDLDATRAILRVLIDPLMNFDRGIIQPEALKRTELVFTFVRNIVLASVQKVYGLDGNTSVREERMINWFYLCSVADIFVIAQEIEDKAFRDVSFLLVEIVRCMCTCNTGKDISHSRYTLHLADGVDAHAIEDKSAEPLWRQPAARQTSRFRGRYTHSARQGEHRALRKGALKSTHGKAKAFCGSHESCLRLARFINTIEELYFSRIVYCSWKHLKDVRDTHDVDEHAVRIYDILHVLTYFMSYSNEGTSLVPIKTSRYSPFARLLSKPFVHWLKVIWEMFDAEGDTYGTSIMQSFLCAFMPLLECIIRSPDLQIKSSGLMLASELVGTKHETSLSHYLLKTLKLSALRASDTDRTILENVHHVSVLKTLLRSHHPGKSYPDSKIVMHHGFNRMLIGRVLFDCTKSVADPQATMYVLQAMKLENPCSFHNFDMLLCYTQLIGNNHRVPKKNQVQEFIRGEVHVLINSLAQKEVNGSSFLGLIFSKNTTFTM